MNSQFFNTPNAAVAVNFRAGSSSLSRAIIRTHHSGLESGVHFADGAQERVGLHSVCPKIDPRKRPVTLVSFRDPVERFRSACALTGVDDVKEKITELEEHGFTQRGALFWPQTRLLQGNTVKVFRFPDQLDDLAAAAGLPVPLPKINDRNLEYPKLTKAQADRVRAIYADDVAVYESITTAGLEVEPRVDEHRLRVRREELVRAARAHRQSVEQGGFLFNGLRIPSDRASQAMINGAVAAAKDDPDFTTTWQVSDTVFAPLDASAIIAMGLALRDHVASAFASQAQAVEQILAAASEAELDAIGETLTNDISNP